MIPIADLRPHPANARNGDTDAIAESLRANGQYRPIVARKATNEILAGNHTYAAALELGWEQIAATYVDVDDEQALRIMLVDNRVADLGVTDPQALSELLDLAEGLDGTGYSVDDLEGLLSRASLTNEGRQLPDHDEEAKPAERVIFRLGEFSITVEPAEYEKWLHEVELTGGRIEVQRRLGLA